MPPGGMRSRIITSCCPVEAMNSPVAAVIRVIDGVTVLLNPRRTN